MGYRFYFARLCRIGLASVGLSTADPWTTVVLDTWTVGDRSKQAPRKNKATSFYKRFFGR